MANKRKQQARDTKQRIFETAMKLINLKGFENVTIQQICKGAGVSNGLFYNYFDSKEQIVIEHTKTIDDYYNHVVPTLNNLRGIEKLLAFNKLASEYIEQNIGKHLTAVLYVSDLTSSKQTFLIDESRYLRIIIHSFIEEACEDGELPENIDSNEVTEHICILIRGSCFNWCLYRNKKYDLAKTTWLLISNYIKGLKA